MGGGKRKSLENWFFSKHILKKGGEGLFWFREI